MAAEFFKLRIDDDLLKWLREQAQEDNRSLNNYIETVLINHRQTKEDGEQASISG